MLSHLRQPNGQSLLSLLSKQRRKLSSQAAAAATREIFNNDDKYQYMQQSQLPTMYFQRSLPRLAIPKLEDTCARYLNAVRPLLENADDYEATKRQVQEFQDNPDMGPKLQQHLLEYDAANKHTSYISEPWFDMYLSDRAALPLNYNPLLVMNDETRPAYKDPAVRTTNLIISSLRFWRTLKNNSLAPEVFHMDAKRSDTPTFRRLVRLVPPFATYLAYTMKAYPLDMSQYDKLFGLTRIPQTHKDILHHSPDSRHILLMRNGNMYAIDVLNELDGSIESPQVIYARILAAIEMDKKRTPAEVALGSLTTLERNKWAQLRQQLLADKPSNQLMQQQIDSALFCVCLDTEKPEPMTPDGEIPLNTIKNLLAGNCHNRWYDKSISLIVSADGRAAVNFEHSWGDGVAVLRYFNEIYKDALEHAFVSAETTPAAINDHQQQVRALNFDMEPHFKQAVAEAQVAHAQIIDSVDMNMLRHKGLHKNLCKQAELSPDAVMQLSFQLAYYRAFGRFVGSYESCSTAAFRHGRTEALRPCTMATKAMCLELMKGAGKIAYPSNLYGMLKECSSVHGRLTREAAMGQGFDRHLYALKYMASKLDMNLPPLYTGEAYGRINHNIISTSTLSSPAIAVGAFGPVVKNGLGIGYSMRTNECGAIVSSYAGQADGKAFVDNLLEAFQDIQNIINKQMSKI